MRAQFLDHAVEIGEWLTMTAVRNKGRITWPGLEVVCGSIEQAEADILMGKAGTLIFLANLCKYRSTERLSAFVEQIVHEVRSMIAADSFRGHGFYQVINWGFCLFMLGELLGEKKISDYSIDLILEGKDQTGSVILDTYWGVGREVALLLALYHRTGHPDLKRLIHRKSEILLRGIRYNGFGAHVQLREVKAAPLLGFAHGSSGALWLLAELYHVLRDENLKALVYQILNYEDSWFNIDKKENAFKVSDDMWAKLRRCAWCDLRYVSYPKENVTNTLLDAYFTSQLDRYNEILKSHPIAFCNGNSGILAARLTALNIFGDAHGLKQVEYLLDDGLCLDVSPMLHIFNVCCGIGGNIEMYILAHGILGKKTYLDFAYKMAKSCIDSHEISGEWKCYRTPSNGLPAAEELSELDNYKYTFLKGVVGIGYSFLRLYDPANTLSLLMPIAQRKLDSPLANDSDGHDDITLNLREREIFRYFGHTIELFKGFLNLDVFPEYIARCPVASAESEVLVFANFLDQKITALDFTQKDPIMKAYSAELYRIEFERTNRVIMDRHLELYLCDATNSAEIHQTQLQVQRDVKLFEVSDLQLAYAFHINRYNQPTVTRISQLQLTILKYLDPPESVKEIHAHLKADSLLFGSDDMLQAIKELVEANIVQKCPLMPAQKIR